MNNEAALVGDDLKGGTCSRGGLKAARQEAEAILNRALRIHAPNFYGSIEFRARRGRIVSRQIVESEQSEQGS